MREAVLQRQEQGLVAFFFTIATIARLQSEDEAEYVMGCRASLAGKLRGEAQYMLLQGELLV